MTSTVTLIRFVLKMVEPGAVTVPRPARQGEVDVEPDTDPWGRPQLPGTSLAGALRAWVQHAAGEAAADAWFGHLLEAGSGGAGVDAVASRVWVLGSRLVDENGADTDWAALVERWSTAISPERGAADAHTLRGERLLAAGARVEVFLRWDAADPADVDRLLSLLVGWRPLLGRGTSRGRGRCQVEALRQGTLHLDRPGDLLRWLTLDGPELVRDVATSQSSRAARVDVPNAGGYLVEVPMHVVGPLHVGAGGDARFGTDPATGRQVSALLAEDGAVVVPGASLKGVVRSRMEFILRSVRLQPAPCLDGRCGWCWPCRVFGHGGGADPRSDSVGVRSRVRFRDAAVVDAATRQRTHVAIDRFTGGALDQLLYTVDGVETGRFTLAVEAGAAGSGALTEPALQQFQALLRLVLADLDDRLVGIGAGTARGYGSVRVDTGSAEATGALPTLPQARRTLAAMVAASPGGSE